MSREGRQILGVAFWILLAYGVLWIAVHAFMVGWPPPPDYEDVPRIDQVRAWNESTRETAVPVSVDGKRVRRIGSRVLGGFIDRHLAYKVECESGVADELIGSLALEARSDPGLLAAFVETFPESEAALGRGLPIVASPHFTHVGRGGPDGDHYAAVYDEAKSTLYLWAHHNF